MNLGRRGLLKLMGVAPAAAGSMAAAAATQAAGFAVPGLSAAASLGTAPQPSFRSGKAFTTFLSFLKDQEAEWREQSKNVQTVDPDIASMRLPLATKCRMQAERNFERRKILESNWFERHLARDGEVRIW